MSLYILSYRRLKTEEKDLLFGEAKLETKEQRYIIAKTKKEAVEKVKTILKRETSHKRNIKCPLLTKVISIESSVKEIPGIETFQLIAPY